MGKHFGSASHGSAPTTVFAKSSISSMERASGPFTLFTASWPAKPLLEPPVGKRPNEGLRVKSPVQAAGIRTDPPKRNLISFDRLRLCVARLAYIGTHSKHASSKSYQRTLATRTSSRRQFSVQRIVGAAVNMCDGLRHHHSHRYRSLDIENRPRSRQQVDKYTVLRSRVVDPRYKSDSRWFPSDLEIVF